MQTSLLAAFLTPLVSQSGNNSPAPSNGPITSGRGLRALTLLSLGGIALVTARGLLTGNWWFFVMLTWNLTLAIFPLGVVLVFRDLRNAGILSRRWQWPALVLWLAFLPNAPYIITDLFHLRGLGGPLLWFDTMTIFLFALTGLLAGLYATLLVHRLLRPQVGGGLTWVIVLTCQWLSGFGIYLGRFGRWNSWDVLAQPFSLLTAIRLALHDHLAAKLTLAYGFVLVVFYVAFYSYIEYDKRS